LTMRRLSTYRVGVELRPPSYFALAALIDGPLHGYAIAQRARELSDGRVRISTGTLYALLERALAESLVTAGEPYVQGGRQRRDYTLTLAGRALLADEAARLAHAAGAVSGRLRATSDVVLT
jgi:PadR family transcriptional regulator PadR